MVCLDATIVNVALPTLARSLGAGLQSLQWVVDGYTLAFAACLLTGGALGDGLGQRGVFAAGLGLFSLASAGCGLASSIAMLVAFRFAQGLGAAALVPCSLALLRHAYQEQGARARAVAIWAGAGGAAVAAGPVAGGLLIHLLGWRSIFLVNVLVGGAAVALTAARVSSVPGVTRRPDLAGQVSAVATLAGLTFALIEGPALGWSSVASLAALLIAACAAVTFGWCEARVTDPMLPPALARQPSFAGSAAVGLLLNLAFYGQLFVLSFFFQQARGESPLEAGLSFLPMTAFIIAANLAAPRVARRVGQATTIIAGTIACAAGMAALLEIEPRTRWWEIALAMVPIGIGGGISIPPLTTMLLGAVPGRLAGVASGAFNASRQIGGAIGVAVFGAMVASQPKQSFMTGMRLSLAVAILALLSACAITARWLRPPSSQPKPPAPPPTPGTPSLRTITD